MYLRAPQSSASACSLNSRSIRRTDGSIAWRNGRGNTPISTIPIASGMNVPSSRPFRSGSLPFFALSSGPKNTFWNIHSR